jgi:hypothetical protein
MFKGKTGFMAGFAAGYVIGAKAGRERYEQIKDAAKAFGENPGVKRLADEVQRTVNVTKDRASSAASRTVETAGSQLADKTGKAREYVNTKVGKGTTTETDVTTPSTPTSPTPTPTSPSPSSVSSSKR